MNESDTNHTKSKASVLRKLMASFYDGLLLIAVLMIASALTVPLTQGGIISRDSILIKFYMLAVCYLFFTWFWVRAGQTLGMRVWHLRIEQDDGQNIDWQQASIRFLSGLPAWGFLFLAFIRSYVPETHQVNNFPSWLINLNPWLLLILGAGFLLSDYWKTSWRNKLSDTQIVYRKK